MASLFARGTSDNRLSMRYCTGRRAEQRAFRERDGRQGQQVLACFCFMTLRLSRSMLRLWWCLQQARVGAKGLVCQPRGCCMIPRFISTARESHPPGRGRSQAKLSSVTRTPTNTCEQGSKVNSPASRASRMRHYAKQGKSREQ